MTKYSDLKVGDRFTIEYEKAGSYAKVVGHAQANTIYGECPVTVTYRKPEPLKAGDMVKWHTSGSANRYIILWTDGEDVVTENIVTKTRAYNPLEKFVKADD